MEKRPMKVNDIPAVLWGPVSGRLFIAVHGDTSHKEDEVIRIAAEAAAAKDCQTLSFDLPRHGQRQEDARLCSPQNCVEDLRQIFAYATTLASDVSLFGCSIGAYFSMLAYADTDIRKALFLSPVVDLVRIIRNMMTWASVSEARLQAEGEIVTPAKTLYWDDYQYVLRHPLRWNAPTALLYGGQDTLCEADDVRRFAESTGARLTTRQEAGHFFHTPAQLAALRQWLDDNITAS